MAYRVRCWMLLAALSLISLSSFAKEPEERIAFQRNDPAAVTVMFADGTGAVDLGPSRLFFGPCVTPALSPDGHTLAFSAKVGDQYKLFTWRLDEHNATIGDPQRVTPADNDLSEKFPAWSPDGKRLAFLTSDRFSKTSLRVINADGTGMVSLTTTTFFASPCWSPDGQQLLYINQSGDRPVLHNILLSGGKGLPVRQDARIISACYSPDGKQIAVLMQRDNGVSDLYIIPPFGIGGKAVQTNITGAKSISWRTPDTIIFNAAKVGTQSGKSFWTITPSGDGLKGITGYADPKQVAFFSIQKCDLTPYVPAAVDPTVAKKPVTAAATAANATPAATETIPEEPVDMAQTLIMHSVTALAPADNATVRGIVPVDIIARPSVAKVNVLVSGENVYSLSTASFNGKIPRFTYYWNTQELKGLKGGDKLPANYSDALRYPDGTYTVCIQGLDASDKQIDQHIITVNVQNQLPNSIVPGGTLTLEYNMSETMPTDYFRVHGAGVVLTDDSSDTEVPQGQLPDLNATLDAAIRRNVEKGLPNNVFGFSADMRAMPNRYPLVFGSQNQAVNLPEFYGKGAYTQNKLGEMKIATFQGANAYLPLSLFTVPFKSAPVKVGDSWAHAMWVVTDLLTREASSVNAVHNLDGFEWINGKQAARIRSEYRVNGDLTLNTTPNSTMPADRGTRMAADKKALEATMDPGNNPGLPPAMGAPATGDAGTAAPFAAAPFATQNTPPGQPGMPAQTAGLTVPGTVPVKKAEGVRYSWYDLTDHKLLRVEDIILHSIPVDVNVEAVAQETLAPGTVGADGQPAAGISIDDFKRMQRAQRRQERLRQQQQQQQLQQPDAPAGPVTETVTVWYLVRYQYVALPAPKKTDE